MGSVDGLIGKGVGGMIARPRHVTRGPSIEAGQRPPGGSPERDQLRVLDPPSTRELLDDELRVEQQVDLAGPQLTGKVEGPDDTRVLGDIVGLDSEVVRDRGVRHGPLIAGVRPCKVVQRGTQRGRSRVPTGCPVGPDDVSATRGRRWIVRARRRLEVGEERLAQIPRSTIAALTSRIAWVMWMPRGQASVQLKIVRHRHTPSLSARISSRSSPPSSRESKMKRWALTIAAGPI